MDEQIAISDFRRHHQEGRKKLALMREEAKVLVICLTCQYIEGKKLEQIIDCMPYLTTIFLGRSSVCLTQAFFGPFKKTQGQKTQVSSQDNNLKLKQKIQGFLKKLKK